MEVQQGGKRERKPQWTSKSTSSKSSAATTPRTWPTSWKTSKADPKAPAPAGAFPCPQTRPEWPPEAPSGPGRGHPAGEGVPGPSEGRLRALTGAPEGGAGSAGVCAPEGAPSNYATSVLRKSRNSKCELGLTFAKSGLRSQLEQPCEQSHTRRGSRATM